jgi:glycosyltransferase involved in cell wall biosynthesis
MSFAGPALVVVPVRDEAERIADCLRALAYQHDAAADGIVLAINNTTDGTAGIVRALRPSLKVPLHVLEWQFPPEQVHAGSARRLGMEHAAFLLGDSGWGDSGALLTTDADARVPPDWIAANLWHLRRGADAVAGRAALDPLDAGLIPARLHADDAVECAYAATLDAIAACLDPEPWDALPRHCEESGASIAVTLAAYRHAGGMPAVPLAEDRRFFAALRGVDARIRHAPEIAVEVSGRIVGRAEGGMADTIRRRLAAPDPYLDSTLEPAGMRARRARLRGQFRRAHAANDDALLLTLARRLGLPIGTLRDACADPLCGRAWAALEQSSPALGMRLVPVRQVARQQHIADRILAALQVEQARPGVLLPTS